MGQTKRLRIGILFNVSPNWLGGIYYILNLIKALDVLDESEKPELVVLYNENLKDFTREIEGLKLTLVPWKFETPLKGYLKSWVTRRNVFSYEIVNKFGLDGIYPEWNQPIPVSSAYGGKVMSVSWFADLQHKYYPEFFSWKQSLLREFRLRLILKNANHLIVSSKATQRDFKKFYALRDDIALHVIRFVSMIDDFNFETLETLREKYRVPEHYYMVSNQFHKHKNHLILLKALAELKKQGSPVHYIITGRMPEEEQSAYVKSLHELISVYALAEHVSFLGVIPRQDQLSLMKYSRAVIQPSLFEGWSTVIEDAKSLQVPVIASNLEVNIEQLGGAGIYFDPHNGIELAGILTAFKRKNGSLLYEDYQTRVKDFAEGFVKIFTCDG